MVAVSPESLAVSVPVDAGLTIDFTETVDDKSIERGLWVTPGGAAKPRIKVSGERTSITFSAPLPESTTVGVLLSTVVKDRQREGRQNSMARPYRWIFSTGPAPGPGRIHGAVERVEAETARGREPGQRLGAL